tara:strand:- start:72334 stop:73191 length:858 start_codon:yes stop_codon:yes gene_type:complete
MKQLSLLIMAAGLGSRYGGLKQLETFGPEGHTLLEYAVLDAIRAGFQRIVFVIKPEMEVLFREKIESRLPKGLAVAYAHQTLDSFLPEGFALSEERTKPWGTGHAVLCAKKLIQGPFVAINADDYYGPQAFQKAAQFLKDNTQDHALVTYSLANTLSPNGSVSRGICETDQNSHLLSVTEHPCIERTESGLVSESTLEPLSGHEPVSLNFWAFQSSIFSTLKEQFQVFLEQHGKDPKAEFYLPHAVSTLIAQKQTTVHALTSTDAWCGVTYAEDRGWVESILARA